MGELVIDSFRFGDSYRISELCELVSNYVMMIMIMRPGDGGFACKPGSMMMIRNVKMMIRLKQPEGGGSASKVR